MKEKKETVLKDKAGQFPKEVELVFFEWVQERLSTFVKCPYPLLQEKESLCVKTGLSMEQLNRKFINLRRRMVPTAPNFEEKLKEKINNLKEPNKNSRLYYNERAVITSAQKTILLRSYSEKQYISRDERKNLAKQTGLSYAQIENWFTNQRRRNCENSTANIQEPASEFDDALLSGLLSDEAQESLPDNEVLGKKTNNLHKKRNYASFFSEQKNTSAREHEKHELASKTARMMTPPPPPLPESNLDEKITLTLFHDAIADGMCSEEAAEYLNKALKNTQQTVNAQMINLWLSKLGTTFLRFQCLNDIELAKKYGDTDNSILETCSAIAKEHKDILSENRLFTTQQSENPGQFPNEIFESWESNWELFSA